MFALFVKVPTIVSTEDPQIFRRFQTFFRSVLTVCYTSLPALLDPLVTSRLINKRQ